MNPSPMPGWMQRLALFLSGRNGADALGKACFILYFLLVILNLFLGSKILSVLILLLLILMVFRFFSRDLSRRRAENAKYLAVRTRVRDTFCRVPLFRSIGAFLSKKVRRISKLPTKCFRTCPSCKAELCLPRRRGKHTVRCPRCANEFAIRIFF